MTKLFAYALRDFDELPYLEQLAKREGFEFAWTAEYPTLENASLAQGFDVVSLMPNPVTAEVLDVYVACGVKHIATRSIGYDHIDLAHAAKLGMRVGHAAYPPESVADWAIMLILMCLRKASYILDTAAVQDFSLNGKIGKDLSGCTVGVIGTGRIGATVIQHLQGFGCKILAYDPYPNDKVAELASYVELEELLAQSDVLTLHAPAFESNHHMLNAETLSLCKDGVVIVNCARGSLIDTPALIGALESGKVGAAGLDTIEGEAGLYYVDKRGERLTNHWRAELMALPNVVVSPHMAFYTDTAVENMVLSSTSALMAFVRGEQTPFEVIATE